jgi:hypothetical protein
VREDAVPPALPRLQIVDGRLQNLVLTCSQHGPDHPACRAGATGGGAV